MESKQGKKPAEWFKILKEPYRSQAIANINPRYARYIINPNSLEYALEHSFDWSMTEQRHQYWCEIYNSIALGETTYLEPELIGNTDNLKPEQMESGKWYFLDTNIFNWLIKFSEIETETASIYIEKAIEINKPNSIFTKKSNHCDIGEVQSIRPATNEEVLKYFPDEKFENVSLINEVNNTQVTEQQNQIESEKVELRPEELVSGEVYKVIDEFEQYFLFTFDKIKHNSICIKNGYDLIDKDKISNENERLVELNCIKKLYHATPEEKALLLGDEETDWKAKFEELKDSYSRLEDYDKELEKVTKEQSNLIENLRSELKEKDNQEKVYFFVDLDKKEWTHIKDLNLAIEFSRDNRDIYEAVKIGVKKSVLVNE